MRRLTIIGLALIAAATSQVPAFASDSVTYRVKRGDTLVGLAERYMVPGVSWQTVAKINRVSDPLRLQPNRTLVIPVKLLKYQAVDARLASWRGNVIIGRQPASRDMKISEGARVVTSIGSFATVQLGDGSRITVPSQSSVLFGRIRRILLNGAYDIDVVVEKGRAETSVTKKTNDQDSYRLRTPVAVSAVRGTQFRVVYGGPQGSSLTEVVEGAVGVSSNANPNSVESIPLGFGADVRSDGQISEQQLLPAPKVLASGRVQKEAIAMFSSMPVDGAAKYRIQIASDAGFVEMLAEQTAVQPKIAVENLPNGTLFARMAAVSSNGMTGMDEAFSFSRRLASLSGSAASEDLGAYRFRWLSAGDGSRTYQFQLWAEGATIPTVDEAGLVDPSVVITNIAPGNYFWRVGIVQVDDGKVVENWTALERLIVPVTK